VKPADNPVVTPDEQLTEIVSTLHSTAEPDFDLIAEVGVGPLETLFLFDHEDALWPRIEQLARDDERFRHALAAVWAFRSARFEEREALLEELGAHEAVTLRILIQRRTFDPQDGYEWRSFKLDGLPEGAQLANLLRGIASHIDQAGDWEPPRLPGRRPPNSQGGRTP
jgi:hypothetical protein